MVGIIGIIAFLTILGFSLLVTKIATVALIMTGLSEQSAIFQARSAFTGTGFTTSESEKIVAHPVRRKIVMLLMVVRSAGLVTIIVSLILSLAGTSGGKFPLIRLLWLGGGAIVLWAMAMSRFLDKILKKVIKRLLTKWTNLDARDYASLLHLYDKYRVMEVTVDQGDWLDGKNLSRCKLTEEGVTVLGVIRGDDGSYVGVPQADTEIYAGDTLILYGRSEPLQELDSRRSDSSGDMSHERAVDDQKQEVQKQDIKETERKRKHKQEQ